jgi:hypothetical protein
MQPLPPARVDTRSQRAAAQAGAEGLFSAQHSVLLAQKLPEHRAIVATSRRPAQPSDLDLWITAAFPHHRGR